MARHATAGRVALLTATGSVSYRELGDRIDRIAGALAPVTAGEVIGLVPPRDADGVAAFLGAMQAGGTPCALERPPDGASVAERVTGLGIGRLLVPSALAAALSTRVPPPLRVIDLASLRGPGPAHGVSGRIDRHAGAMLQTTSGSTGQPKAVRLTHGNLLSNARGIIERTGLTASDRLLHVMPLHHTNGVNNQLLAPLLAGATVVLVERYDPTAVAAQLVDHRITYLTGVPTLFARALPHLRGVPAAPALRFLRCGSAPITAALHEEVEDAFGVRLVVSYGLAEATCTSTMNPPDDRRVGSVGTALPGQRVRAMRPDDGAEVPTGEEGEICIAGPSVMPGYVGAATGPPLRDGWLRTGDLGRFDPDGYLTVTGRLKDVILRGGETLSPQQIEEVLARHPAVAACCVVGRTDTDLGEVPEAHVVRRPGAAVDAETLRTHVADALSRRHVPATVVFRSELPVNAVGKVDRRALREA